MRLHLRARVEEELTEEPRRAAWDRFLRGLSPSANPYLVPGDTLLAEGFTGPLYRMD